MPLPGWDHPILQRRRQAMRDAVTSYLPLPARRTATATPLWTWFTRFALWAGIGMLVAVFAIATDPTKVAVVAILTAIAAPAWRQLSWAFRTIIVLGLVWLSVAEFGTGLGLGLDVLLIAWWWLPAQISGGVTGPVPEPEQEEDLASLVTPVGVPRPYELPFSGSVPASLRRFAEERHLSEEEVTMLASIRFPGEPPRTPARWHHIYNAIRLSRWLDKEGV
jgi:hypothetical protein